MIKNNIIANVIGRIWGFISVYLFVPLYLKLLGIEAFGLVGFYATLLGVLVFADMGFTATLNRELARLSGRKDSTEEMRDLLRTYELTYLCISFALAIVIWIVAPLIVTHWLHPGLLNPQEITLAIRLMGIAIAFQLPSGLYIGGLMGLQQQIHANFLQITWGVYRGVGTVLVLWLLSPTILNFAIWQIISNCIYCLLARKSLWRALSSSVSNHNANFKWQMFQKTWRYASGMAGMAVVSILLTQIDKLAVSKMLSLEMLGFYTIAGSLAAIPLILASSIALATFPRFTTLAASGDREQLSRLYHRSCELVALAIIPSSLTIALFSEDLIHIWTGSATTANETWLVASLLLGGQLLQAITVVPYYIALAYGDVKLNLRIGIISVLLITPLLIILVLKFGIIGAGFSWLIMNICTLPPYMYYLHRRFLPSELGQWLNRSVLWPFAVGILCLALFKQFTPYSASLWLTFIYIGIAWSITFTATAVSMPEARRFMKNKANHLFGLAHD